MPWMKRWVSEIHLKLFSEKERDKYFVEFLVDDLLRADTSTRFAAYGLAITNRFYSPNEVRALENLPPYEGGNEFVNPNTTSTTQQPGASTQ
jgi:phage portal protein BeeE